MKSSRPPAGSPSLLGAGAHCVARRPGREQIQDGEALRAGPHGGVLHLREKRRIHRRRGGPGRTVRPPHQPAEEMGAEATVRAYKGLSIVEPAFRSYQTVDLKGRPPTTGAMTGGGLLSSWAGSPITSSGPCVGVWLRCCWTIRIRLGPAVFRGGTGRRVSGPPNRKPGPNARPTARRGTASARCWRIWRPSFAIRWDRRSPEPSLYPRDSADAVATAGAGPAGSSPIGVPRSGTRNLDRSVYNSVHYVDSILEVQFKCAVERCVFLLGVNSTQQRSIQLVAAQTVHGSNEMGGSILVKDR